MEELRIQEFVHRVSTDEVLRQQLTDNPDSVIQREGFTSPVARVITRLRPHMTGDEPPESECTGGWWCF